jgi:biopolymer transport protein ExbD
LPSAKSSKTDNKKSLNIQITKDNKIYINEKPILKENFAKQIATFDKNSSVKISCDKSLKFEDFVYILDTLKLKEFNNIGIVTKNE